MKERSVSPKVADFLATLSPAELAEADAWLATHVPPRKVAGWKSIAVEIGYSERASREFASRTYDPLPIEYDVAGDCVWAVSTALRAWVRRQNVPYGLRLAAIELGRERRRSKTAAARAALKNRHAATHGADA